MPATSLPSASTLHWDVCQEVIAWEGYYEPGPVDFRKETVAELIAIGGGVPAAIELGYHLCYGSPADEHDPAEERRDHGRDRQCGLSRGAAADPVLPPAGAETAH